MPSSRRIFIRNAVGAGALLASARSFAADPPKVAESEPAAAALGYKLDTTKVDTAKFPKHTNDQRCGNCQLYQGKPGDAFGPCAIFAGKLVSSSGWCNAWVKKA
jgi:hypothetical protein